MSVRVEQGDSREVLKTLADNSVESCVTDPPYHLTSIVKRFGATGSAPAQQGTDGRFKRLSGGFMNKKWDAPDTPPIDPAFANWFAGFVDGEGCFHVHKKTVNGTEVYDCQFSITLRSDDTPIINLIRANLGGIGTVAQRSAPKTGGGKAQIRYCISSQRDCWRLREILAVFPLRAKKARDFEIWSAALDAWLAHKPGESWEDVAYFREALMAVRQYGAAYHPSQLFHYQWAREVFRVLKPGGHVLAFCGTRTYHRMAAAIEDAGFEIRDAVLWLYGAGFPKSHNLDGKVPGYDGWGTALKPAAEIICLARKPLTGTVAENVLQHGTGALNIDASRIHADDAQGGEYTVKRLKPGATLDKTGGNWRPEEGGVEYRGEMKPGRWPANVIHDGSAEVIAAFPERDGGGNINVSGGDEREVYGKSLHNIAKPAMGDSGSAARFFYSAKADAEDRFGSKHPTVKPIDLIAYLCRLVTPPGGTVLDPFAGSGTTGAACMREGFDCILIEREAEYIPDIMARIEIASAEGRHPAVIKHRNVDPAKARGEDLPMFAAPVSGAA